LIAVSANVKHRLQGAEMSEDGTITLGEDYSWLEKYPLVKRIGTTIEVYDLDGQSSLATGH
jgi:hypothetical protein